MINAITTSIDINISYSLFGKNLLLMTDIYVKFVSNKFKGDISVSDFCEYEDNSLLGCCEMRATCPDDRGSKHP
jgi:hypothetical protein